MQLQGDSTHDEPDWSIILQVWIERGLLASALQICGALTAVNIVRHKKRTQRLMQTGKAEPGALIAWSTACYMWCIFAIRIWTAFTIPYVCESTSVLVGAAFFYPHVFLSLYQLARLKAAFNEEAHHNDLTAAELAYPNCIYIALFLYGLLIILHVFFAPLPLIINGNLEMVEKPLHSGCWFVSHVERNLASGLMSGRLLSYLVWDWLIVGMYIHKLHQLQVRFKAAQKLHRKIRAVIKRILLLIAISEVVFTFGFSMDFFVKGLWSDILVPIDSVVTFGTLHLMMARNDSDYVFTLRYMRRCGCLKLCCCCLGDMVAEYARVEMNDREETTHQDQVEIEVCTVPDIEQQKKVDTETQPTLALPVNDNPSQ